MGVSKREKVAEKSKTRPQFCTVIVFPALQLRKLELPKEFVENHGKHLSKLGYLRVPNGRNWAVDIMKYKGNSLLHRGWSQFAEHYSIASGYVLIFRYDGSSRFRVRIFDTTSTEVKYSHNYSLRVPRVDKPEKDEQRTKDDTSADKLDEIQPQIGESSDEESAEDRVLQRAKAFQSRNPFFITHIQKRNLSYNSGPMFPTSHSTKYFKENDGDNNSVTLCINKSTWSMKYRVEKMATFCISLASGWKEFVLENHLKEGDICVYELIHSAKKTYNVHIFRISHKMDGPTLKEEEIEDDDDSSEVPGRSGKGKQLRLMDKADAFVGGNPGFIINMRKSYADLRRAVRVPYSHAKRYLKDKGGDHNVIVVHGKEGKTWKMKYETELYTDILIGSWSEFRSDNHLEIDDICAFKLIDINQMAYAVAIFRANGE